MRSILSLTLAVGLYVSGSCSKESSTVTPAPPEAAEAAEAAVASSASGVLAYQETVDAIMERLVLNMTYEEAGERKTLDGAVTMMKQRFATVEHPTSKMKRMHLRRWARVHIAEISHPDIPRANRTQESPITNAHLEMDRVDDGWRIRPLGNQETPEVATAINELEKVERAYTQFYRGQSVREGESWQVPPEAVSRWFGDEVSEMTGDINLRGVRTETLNKQPCTVIQADINVSGKMSDDEGKISDLDMVVSGEIWRAVELGQDLKVELNGTIKLTAIIPEQKAEVVISGPISITETRKLRK